MSILDFFRRRKGSPSAALTPSVDELLARVAAHRRTGWLPRTEEAPGPPAGAKLGGMPLLGIDEAWPACGNCQRPMQLFLQLPGASLPAGMGLVPSGRVLQLFYCTSAKPHCESTCSAWQSPGASTCLRLVNAEVSPGALAESPVADAFPERRIAGWDAVDDYPCGEELDLLGAALDEVEEETLMNEGYPREKDKLGGWPCWIQSVSYPECPDCGRAMSHLFQIDSHDNLPYMFGDAGMLHLFMCPEHPQRLGMNWDCA